MRTRAKKVIQIGAALLLGGCTYAVFCDLTGFGIPCVFHLLTGLQCPGCGVSRMCLALLRLDLPGAWEANPVILCMLPLGAVLGVRMVLRYIRTGSSHPTAPEEWTMLAMTAVLVLFGILRNLPTVIRWISLLF